MTIIFRNGKYIDTDTPDENKRIAMEKLGERVTKANREMDRKKKSTLLLKKALTILDPMATEWPGRQDLQETIVALREAIDKDNLNNQPSLDFNEKLLLTIRIREKKKKFMKNYPQVILKNKSLI